VDSLFVCDHLVNTESALPTSVTPAMTDTTCTLSSLQPSLSSHNVLLFYTGLCTDTFDKLFAFCCGVVKADLTKSRLRDELILTLFS